jgi:hypothetical protein
MPREVNPDVARLIGRCWAGDPARRPMIKDLCKILARVNWKVVPGPDEDAVTAFVGKVPVHAGLTRE